MKTRNLFPLFFTLIILASSFKSVPGATNPADAAVLQNLYFSLNSPSQLHSWSVNGTDPCGESWQGVQCSSSAVTQINLRSLGLTGGLGYMLAQLTSGTVLDLSNNHITGSLPYFLPPNLQRLDLSFNILSGSLPESFSKLSNLSTLHLQNNRLSGNLNSLSTLPLQDLNVENNQFTGWIPSKFQFIPHLKDSGNNFSTSPAPPPPPNTPPPHSRNHNVGSSNSSGNKSTSRRSNKTSQDNNSVLNGGAIAGIVIAGILAVIVVLLIVLFFISKTRDNIHDEEKQPSTTAVFIPVAPSLNKAAAVQAETKFKSSPVELALKPPPSERYKTLGERISGRKSSSKKTKSPPIAAISCSVADLQLATNSFSQENLIGEGSFGRVYKAELPNGKLLAVKKIDTPSSSSSVHNDEDFIEIVSHISRLRHVNIVELIGYCTEHGQRLLAYDYFGKGTLHEILHCDDEMSRRELVWNVRVKIALGTARALEYLHEVCMPAVVHKNFKSANILLDDELNPHLSDCGIAAFSPSPERQVSTEMMGSFGYSAPEYAMSGIYTVKSDVYSFGVVMLELLTGRKPLDSTRSRQEQSLVRWATPQLHDIDALSKMVDPALKGLYPAKSLSRFADIISLCVQPEPEFRPPISEVVQSLVRLMQRANLSKRRYVDEQRISDSHGPSESSF